MSEVQTQGKSDTRQSCLSADASAEDSGLRLAQAPRTCALSAPLWVPRVPLPGDEMPRAVEV